MDEHLVHQLPEPLPNVATHHPHWRESYFFIAHRPDAAGRRRDPHDGVLSAARGHGLPPDGPGRRRAAHRSPRARPTTATRTPPTSARRASRSCGRSKRCASGPIPTGARSAWTSRSGPAPSRTACGGARCGPATSWSGTRATSSSRAPTTAPTPSSGTTYEVDRWWGQRDHSWGIRDHGRCPLWLWFQVQLDDGFLGVWHWELRQRRPRLHRRLLGRHRRQRPGPVDRLRARRRVDRRRRRATPLRTSTASRSPVCAAPRRSRSKAVGASPSRPRARFDRPYEPFQRGGLNQMRVRTDDGREGTAIFEVTGARHHRYFPDTEVVEECCRHDRRASAHDRRHAERADAGLAHRGARRRVACIEGVAVTDVDLTPVGTGQMCDSVRLAAHLRPARPPAPATVIAKLPGGRPDQPGHRPRAAQLRDRGPLLPAARARRCRCARRTCSTPTSTWPPPASCCCSRTSPRPRQGDQLAGCSPEQADDRGRRAREAARPALGRPAARRARVAAPRPRGGPGSSCSAMLPVFWDGFRERYDDRARR